MKPIQFPIKRFGWTLELIERRGLVCLVKASRAGAWCYEVVKLQPDGSYPSRDDWEQHVQTYCRDELSKARKRLADVSGDDLALVSGYLRRS